MNVIHLLNQYGYIVLFFSLMVELIIIPIPNEALMSYVGVLCYQGKMNLYLSIVTAGLGAVSGVTVSYWIGYKLGVPFFRKYGHYIHLGPEKLEKMSRWYKKYGKILLIISFFVPGVRHVASIISGVIKLPYRYFALFGYIGVFLWTGTFISLGNLLGPTVDQFQGDIKKWLVAACIIFGFFVVMLLVVRARINYIKESFMLLYQSAFKRFRSFLKIKFMILFIFILFVVFFSLMIGMIEDFVANEFGHFNLITRTIVFDIVSAKWSWLMNFSSILSTWTAIGLASLLTAGIILIQNKNKWLELSYFFATMIGSFLFSKGIRWLLHYLLAKNTISTDFPNVQTVLLMSVYGSLLFTVVRHSKRYLLSISITVILLLLFFAYFLSGIYLHDLKPSDLIGGYVFSAVWLTGMLLSMEMFRLLSIVRENQKE